jgi:hypothetical protein
MSPFFFSQVALETSQVMKKWYLDHTTLEWIILIGATGLVTLLIAGWAKYIRKSPHREHSHHHHRHHRHRHHSEPTETAVAQTEANAPAPPEKRRRRRRSHHRRRLNPTLAETGGLPPIREEGTPPPGL